MGVAILVNDIDFSDANLGKVHLRINIPDTWYTDSYTNYSEGTNGTDSTYFPLMQKPNTQLNNVAINAIKWLWVGSGKVELCVYDFDGINQPTEVSSIGTFDIVEGENITKFPVKFLNNNQVIGVKGVTGSAGIRYHATAKGSEFDGGWAGSLFNGTIPMAIGYKNE